MEDINNLGTIASKYIIKEKKGYGSYGNVYLVEDTTNKAQYAAKVLIKKKDDDDYDTFQNEINILNELNRLNNPYLIRLITSGEGIVERNNKQKTRKYIILENASNGELLKYVTFPNEAFNEKFCKLIFFKILKGIQALHEAGICHRDIKPDNILFDEKFNIKICDFGYSTHNKENLDDYLGTKEYAAPEILKNKPYDGFRADIFSLGIVLFCLITGKFGFENQSKYYESDSLPKVSEEFKKIFYKMIAKKSDERYKNIEEILNSEWMLEIVKMEKEELKKLEKELNNELKKRKIINDSFFKLTKSKQKLEVKDSSGSNSSGTKAGNNDINVFDLSLKPNFAKTGLNMDYYIKIEDKINPANFMNNLATKIKNTFNDDCLITFFKNKFKFNVTFEEGQKEEVNEENLIEEVNQPKINIQEQDTVIQIKIFESYKGGYILRFTKKKGELNDYLGKLKTIYSLIIKKDN